MHYLTFLNTKKYNVVCPNYIYDVTVVIKMNMPRSNLFMHQPIKIVYLFIRFLVAYKATENTPGKDSIRLGVRSERVIEMQVFFLKITRY